MRRDGCSAGLAQWALSEHLAERQIDAGGAGQRVLPGFQRRDAVIDEARGTAPDRHVAVFDAQAADRIAAPLSAPQEYGGQAQRDGDDGRPGILFVAVLVEAEFAAGRCSD